MQSNKPSDSAKTSKRVRHMKTSPHQLSRKNTEVDDYLWWERGKHVGTWGTKFQFDCQMSLQTQGHKRPTLFYMLTRNCPFSFYWVGDCQLISISIFSNYKLRFFHLKPCGIRFFTCKFQEKILSHVQTFNSI